MVMIRLSNTTLTFGAPPLLDGMDLTIEEGERVCLVGRNGCGKSTLLKILAGTLLPDSGQRSAHKGTRISILSQDVELDFDGTVLDAIAKGAGPLVAQLRDYYILSRSLPENPKPQDLLRLEQLQAALEEHNAWDLQRRVKRVAENLKLPIEAACSSLSGGMKRRVLLGQALVSNPDLLLLDEPTNHLDIDSITWLEEYLQTYRGSVAFVTHDRMFLRKLASRIVELDRGKLTSYPGSYDSYLTKKEHLLQTEARHRELFDKHLAQEEVWIRKGILARRTRNEGRVRLLHKLRETHRQRRDTVGRVDFQIEKAKLSGKEVLVTEDVHFAYDEAPVITDFSTRVVRGDRIGIIGPNGCGKSTLLKLLLGELKPQSGTVTVGTKLEVAYFDQHRTQLDSNTTVREAVAEGNEFIVRNGQRKHILGYLKDFLFTPERAQCPVNILSGGEKNRLLLARLFTRPFNLLILDEPTNDLDVETLELLEELLMEYDGTLLIVSHDREFLNQVITSTLSIHPDGRVESLVGGYDDWLQKQPQKTAPVKAVKPKATLKSRPRERPKKRSFKESRELESLPELIGNLEAEQEELHQTLSSPEFYKESGDRVRQVNERLEVIETELKKAYSRWEELEELPE